MACAVAIEAEVVGISRMGSISMDEELGVGSEGCGGVSGGMTICKIPSSGSLTVIDSVAEGEVGGEVGVASGSDIAFNFEFRANFWIQRTRASPDFSIFKKFFEVANMASQVEVRVSQKNIYPLLILSLGNPGPPPLNSMVLWSSFVILPLANPRF